MRNHPATIDDLSILAKNSCHLQKQRVLRHRKKNYTDDGYKSTKDDSWDLPRVVVACGSLKAPFKVEKRYSRTTLKNGHKTLKSAYSKVGMVIGQKLPRQIKQRIGKPYWDPGHCAEPHAVHALLNTMDKFGVSLQIKEIRFGKAFKIMNGKEEHYCNTCKTVFPQLK